MDGADKSFQMGEVMVPAVRGVSLDGQEGELVVRAGSSGSGKSTILNILGGLDTVSAGRVLFRGRELSALAYDSEMFRFPVICSAATWGWTFVLAVLFAVASHLLVQRVIHRFDWLEALQATK